jgi:hypothetical protein
MALFNFQPSFPTGQSGNKKTIIIAGVSIFAIAIIAALIAGLFAPASTPAQLAQSNSEKEAPVDEEISPFPSVTGVGIPTKTVGAPIPTGVTPEYVYVPEPTDDVEKLFVTKPVTPSPTPLPGPFYTANGKQNDLILYHYKRDDWDITLELQLINTRTREVRLLGYTYEASPGDSRFFSKDFSQVIFLGGSKTDYQKISIYSILQRKIIKEIRLGEIKQRLPSLALQHTATLSRMELAPDGRKVAISYGNTFNVSLIDPATNIIVIDLASNKMQLLPARGLVRGWKDNTTLEYELNTADPNANAAQEVKITGF